MGCGPRGAGRRRLQRRLRWQRGFWYRPLGAGREARPHVTEMPAAEPSPTSARLRHEIDSGRTGDKIGNIDPAAAPLGTDEEASGTPPSREAIRMAMAHEVKRPSSGPRLQSTIFDSGVIIFIGVFFALVLIALATGYALEVLI